MEIQQRYRIGKRQENGNYPVSVDGANVGYIYRHHRAWRAAMPGLREEPRFITREEAAAYLVRLIDQGHRPHPDPTPTARLGTTGTYTFLPPDLRPTIPNFVRAAEAMARLAELGWEPLRGYPGADQPWRMRCKLCGWEGYRFWSHLRGRNGDNTPRPAYRHPGCLPIADHAGKLAALREEPKRVCNCSFQHPVTVTECLSVFRALERAWKNKEHAMATLFSRAILEPCPAASNRAVALRNALNHREG
ncbi:hypothetical protein ABZV75_40010 [Streptomyces flaveolus]|uniref:hypothetical protein n=1 Tax=Streptomyces flaveolus TaxID=67297 RepID=UPI0033BA9CDA